MTKPSRFFENGFEAARGGSFCVDSADSGFRHRLHGVAQARLGA
jgi:hypothetical protein